VLGVVSAACTSPQNLWAPYQPVVGSAGRGRSEIVQRAVVAITEAGGEIETSDGAAGVVVSKWFEASGITTDNDRFRIRVTVADDGSYELVALCEEKVPRSQPWTRCTHHPGQLPRFVLDALACLDVALR
jgi:hypothetical protein